MSSLDTNATLHKQTKNTTTSKPPESNTAKLNANMSNNTSGAEKSKFLQPESIRLQDYQLMVDTMNSDMFKGLFSESGIFGELKITTNKPEEKRSY